MTIIVLCVIVVFVVLRYSKIIATPQPSREVITSAKIAANRGLKIGKNAIQKRKWNIKRDGEIKIKSTFKSICETTCENMPENIM
jgi:hypothetical protein